MFQSLFLWNLRQNLGGSSSQPLANYRFNPCFCGTCSRTVAEANYRDVTKEFQSLFLWNLLSNTETVDVDYKTVVRFQSLFLWNLLSNSICPRSANICPTVSILVFVELALEPS